MNGGGGVTPLLECIYRSARKRALKFVPVFRVGETDRAHAGMVVDATQEDGRGLALRWSVRSVTAPSGMTVTDYLGKLLTDLCSEVSRTDLLLDLGYIDQDSEIHPDDLGPDRVEGPRRG